jgi:hypothetical protein
VRVNQDGLPLALDPSTCPMENGFRYLAASCETFSPPFVPSLARRQEVASLAFPDDAQSRSRVTYFADVSLRKNWEQWTARLSYRRQDDSSGAGFSSIADIVSGSLSWEPSPRWLFSFSAAWIRQEQAGESFLPVVQVSPGAADGIVLLGIPLSATATRIAEATAIREIEFDNEFEQTQITLSFRTRYRLTRRVSIVSRLVFVDRDENRNLGRGIDYSRFRGAIGVFYEFDPIRL